MDVATGAVSELGGFADAKNISPQWTSDGKSIYFLSDRQGITNIYRTDVDSEKTTQLTNMLTGASGITAFSPAMSFAGGRLVFSAYENDGYSIYALDTAEQLAGEPAIDLPRNAAVLPPWREAAGLVSRRCRMRRGDCRRARKCRCQSRISRSGVSISPVSRPFGVGVGPFGTYATGGVSFVFSDMLGNHVDRHRRPGDEPLDEFGGSDLLPQPNAPLELGHVARSVIPYVSRGYAEGFSGNTFVQREYRYLQRDQSAGGFLTYPFSRSWRVEISGDYRRISQSYDVKERTYTLTAIRSTRHDPLAEYPTLNLGEGGTGARLRHVDLRRDQPDSRQPLPRGVHAERRLAHVYRAC